MRNLPYGTPSTLHGCAPGMDEVIPHICGSAWTSLGEEGVQRPAHRLQPVVGDLVDIECFALMTIGNR